MAKCHIFSKEREITEGNFNWELYKVIREHWTHEDQLINHRVTWLILAQGLMLTAYGVLLPRAVNGVSLSPQATRLIQCFPFAGILLALGIGYGILAALSAMDDIRERYNLAGFDKDKFPLVPSKSHLFSGSFPAKSLPLFFIGIWFLVWIG